MKHLHLFENFGKLNDNFWKWFGNSKIVEEKKKSLFRDSTIDDKIIPMVMYHGSPHVENIKTFESKKGYYFFTNDKYEAERYTDVNGMDIDHDAYAKAIDEKIMSCYIKAENPFDPENMNDSEKKDIYEIIITNLDKFYTTTPDSGLYYFTDEGYGTNPLTGEKYTDDETNDPNRELIFEFLKYFFSNDCDNYLLIETEEVQKWIRSKNYDSFYTIESGGGIRNVAVYNPNQIKSIKNNGNYSDSSNIFETF